MKEMAEKRTHLTSAILAIYFGGGQVYVYCEDHKNTTLFLYFSMGIKWYDEQ